MCLLVSRQICVLEKITLSLLKAGGKEEKEKAARREREAKERDDVNALVPMIRD